MNTVLRAGRLARLSTCPKISSNFVIRSLTTQTSESATFNEDTLRKKILENAMKHVPEHGFTVDAINEGVIEAGLSSASTNGIFQNGSFDLIDFFYKKSNADMAEYLEGLIKEGTVTRKNELIRLALIHRLKLTQPYIKHWPNAMATLTFHPTYALSAIENLLRLCDEIWYQCGDQSTDFNWYSKRLILAGIYKSSEICMIQDTSEGFTDTIQFLDNRMKDQAEFHKFKSQFGNVEQAITGTLSVLKNVMRK